jgi:MscS family membrane protein
MNLPYPHLALLAENAEPARSWWENPWLILLKSVAVGYLAGRLAAWALRRTAQRCEARGHLGRAQIARDLAGPVSLALLTLGLSFGRLGLDFERLGLSAENAKYAQFVLAKALMLLYSIVAIWFAYNLVNLIEVGVRRMRRSADAAVDRPVVLLISRSLRVFLVILGVLFVAKSVFGQDIGAWLAGLGIAGLAVSLAAQDSLKQLFGSITILLDRSFRVGDHVITCGHDGMVEDVGFRSTKIRTSADRLVTIPNATLVNSPIENLSRRQAVSRTITLMISGRTPSPKIRELQEALRAVFDEQAIAGPVHPAINGAERSPQVRFEDFHAGDFKLTVTYWYSPASDPDYAAHAERVNLRIVEELQKAGVEIGKPG